MIRREIFLHGEGSSPSLSGRAHLWGHAILALLLILALGEGRGEADLYQYKDQNGNWIITDIPPDRVKDLQTIRDGSGRSPRASGFLDIEKELMRKHPPQNEIEAASLCTVTIRSPLGVGSGFFVNENGHILTNKHVLRGDERQLKETEKSIAQIDERLADEEAAIASTEEYLRRVKAGLDDYRAAIDRAADSHAKEIAMQRYKSQSDQYELYESQFRKRRRDFEDRKEKYRKEKWDFSQKSRMAKHESRFTVVLKDGTELSAGLIAVSNDHDLALLQVSECRSPYIPSGAPTGISQGKRVYAIGSPLGVSDSVSAGIISGYDRDYIRTDAKIYPGNSGGPLITAEGKVIGINTLKLITRKFEGMGFAVPVQRAFQEFRQYLGTNP